MMFSKTVEKAYAKINFGLQVFPKSKDAYNNSFHNIEGVFQTIDLYDELIVTWNLKNDMEPACVVSCDFMNLPEKNTLNTAYSAFCSVVGQKIKVPAVHVELKKNIPSGGGLGGGSADAAALIRAMERICGVMLTDEQLDLIASKVGSDVFFFVHCDREGKGCALVSGRGEIVKKIQPRNDLYLLLIFPAVTSSTKVAYDLVDEFFAEGKKINCPDFSDLEAIYNSDLEKWTFKNTFTSIIANTYSQIGIAIEDLKNGGCCFSEMSGSGSTVFGVFTLKQQADSLRNLLADKWNCKLVNVV